MTLEQLMGKYARLRTELAAAYGALFWNTPHIARLDEEIASTVVAITEAQPQDEQTSETLPGLLHLSAQEAVAEYSTPFGAGLAPGDGLASR